MENDVLIISAGTDSVSKDMVSLGNINVIKNQSENTCLIVP